MVVPINPPRQALSRQAVDPRSQADKNLDRLLRGLQIAQAGFGIAVDYQQFQNFREERAARLPAEEAQEIQRQQAAAGLAEARVGLEETRAGIEEKQVTAQLKEAQRKKVEKESQVIQRDLDRIKDSAKGFTDAGKPMSDAQLKSQSFLERSIKATDRMKEASPDVSPDLMQKQIKALREAGKISFLGGVSDFAATVFGQDAMQILPEQDKKYLLNAMELSNAIIRDETGAQANAQEIAFRMGQFVPAPGDTAETLAAKAELVNDTLDGLRTKTARFSQPLTRDESLRFNYKKIKAAEARARGDQLIETRRAAPPQQQEPSLLERGFEAVGEFFGLPERPRGLLPPGAGRQNKKQVPRRFQ
jgi:hypothetical protein